MEKQELQEEADTHSHLQNFSPKTAPFHPKSMDSVLFLSINVQPDLGFFIPVNSGVALS
jgi:hypothetical protein